MDTKGLCLEPVLYWCLNAYVLCPLNLFVGLYCYVQVTRRDLCRSIEEGIQKKIERHLQTRLFKGLH